MAATHSTRPIARVLSTLTTSLLRFSESTSVRRRSLASANSPFFYNDAPGSVVLWCVALLRILPLKSSALELRPVGLSEPLPSLGVWLTHASIVALLTQKWSLGTKPCHSTRCSMQRKNRQ